MSRLTTMIVRPWAFIGFLLLNSICGRFENLTRKELAISIVLLSEGALLIRNLIYIPSDVAMNILVTGLWFGFIFWYLRDVSEDEDGRPTMPLQKMVRLVSLLVTFSYGTLFCMLIATLSPILFLGVAFNWAAYAVAITVVVFPQPPQKKQKSRVTKLAFDGV